ncbi:polyprenyl diphosphate synthase [Streptomyces sp. A1277]|uniref:polyprenyl diphosphate synthase n=1 Tax=Streptomyces sp. A1277 TaxID=2563103 RepID=UPI001F0EFFF5|nr:polyprenyl diphosphate synthase [Streptomyces sp. A1277]
MFAADCAQAEIYDPQLKAAYKTCHDYLRSTRAEEFWCLQLMPPALRPACWALFAAYCLADDLADTTEGDGSQRLRAWREALDTDLRLGTSQDPVRQAVVHTMWCWNLKADAFDVTFTALEKDALRTAPGPATWQQWRARSKDINVPFLLQCLTLLRHAGLDTPLHLTRLDAYQQLSDGLFLTDSLTDLADDLSRGDITLPAEELHRFGTCETDLSQRRWTPAVQALISHLLATARTWLDQPELWTGLPPGPAVVLRTGCTLYRARLHAAEKAGPALLQYAARPDLAARLRVIGPGRLLAATTWHLFPLPELRTAPPPVHPALPAPRTAPTGLLEPPQPHAGGARPPALPAKRMPRHVAIIMDGNGRWAGARGLPRNDGHKAGGKALIDVMHGAAEIGLPHLTVYLLSTENLEKRPPQEINKLLAFARQQLQAGDFLRYDVRIRWAGLPDGLPGDFVDLLHTNEEATKGRTGLNVTFCLNYGGRSELTQAADSLADAARTGQLNGTRVSEHLLRSHLPLGDLPDVDLLWRTGGEQRISNFLPWHTAYAELLFTDKLWPDIDRRDLWEAMTEYTHRHRRYGAVPALQPVVSAQEAHNGTSG